MLDIAKEVEAQALHDDHLIALKLCPNVDLYCGMLCEELRFV